MCECDGYLEVSFGLECSFQMFVNGVVTWLCDAFSKGCEMPSSDNRRSKQCLSSMGLHQHNVQCPYSIHTQ